jgi:hypothetical protein
MEEDAFAPPQGYRPPVRIRVLIWSDMGQPRLVVHSFDGLSQPTGKAHGVTAARLTGVAAGQQSTAGARSTHSSAADRAHGALPLSTGAGAGTGTVDLTAPLLSTGGDQRGLPLSETVSRDEPMCALGDLQRRTALVLIVFDVPRSGVNDG